MQGFNFVPSVLAPKLEKLNPVTGLQNILFKPKTYLELVKNILKFTIVFFLVYTILKSDLRDLVVSSRLDLSQTAAFVPKLLFDLLYKVGGIFVIFGAADFAVQRKMYMNNLMMSKEEVKREFKEQEGDPEIKHHRKSLHMALLRDEAAKKVPTAKAVVVNPTHIAVALQYDEEHMNAPQIAAKGEMHLAQKIIKIARKHNVPVIRNVPLARSLFVLEVEEEVPEELYQAVAEILNLAAKLAEEHSNE
jgi:flagellar biosynthesis protein FlhB